LSKSPDFYEMATVAGIACYLLEPIQCESSDSIRALARRLASEGVAPALVEFLIRAAKAVEVWRTKPVVSRAAAEPQLAASGQGREPVESRPE
jgi:hypothetical protein